jgi:hypothetical protein
MGALVKRTCHAGNVTLAGPPSYPEHVSIVHIAQYYDDIFRNLVKITGLLLNSMIVQRSTL